MPRQILSESFRRGFQSMKHQRYHQTFTCLGLYIAKNHVKLFVFQCLYKIPAQDNMLCGDIFIQLDFWYPFCDIVGNQRSAWLSCDLQQPNYRASSVKDRKDMSFWHKSGSTIVGAESCTQKFSLMTISFHILSKSSASIKNYHVMSVYWRFFSKKWR